MRMKRISLLITSVLVMTSLVGCGSTASSASSTTETKKLSGKIVFATTRTDIADTKLKDLADEFVKQNPGTDVSFEGIKDYDQTVATRVAAGEAPDIYYHLKTMTKDTLSQYFLPMDDLGFTKDSIDFYSTGQGTDGKLYGVTDSVSYTGVAYNKKAFAAAGITATPKTMDEFYAACEKLKAKNITAMGTAFKDEWTLFPWDGIDYVSVAQTGDIKHKLDYATQDKLLDEAMVSSFKTIRTMNQKGYLEKDLVSSGWDQFKKDIAQAKTGMYYVETWFPPQMLDGGAKTEDLGMFPYPGSKAILASQGKTWGISKDSKSPELAKAFFKYVMLDGKYATAQAVISSLKGQTPSDAFVKELLASGLPVVENLDTPKQYTELINKSEINLDKTLQSYILAPNDAAAEKVIADTNAKWANAKK